jgi:hypothetical protein
VTKAKVGAIAASAVLLMTLVTGCGKSLPRTKGNLALCNVLEKVLDNKATVVNLTGATFETANPISEQLRQNVGQYEADVQNSANPGTPAQDASTAEADCKSLGAPVAKGF